MNYSFNEATFKSKLPEPLDKLLCQKKEIIKFTKSNLHFARYIVYRKIKAIIYMNEKQKI